MQVPIQGRFITHNARPYNAFQTREGETRPAGVTHHVWVLDADGELHDIRANSIPLPLIESLTFGVQVKAMCEARANNNKMSLSAVQLSVASQAPKAA